MKHFVNDKEKSFKNKKQQRKKSHIEMESSRKIKRAEQLKSSGRVKGERWKRKRRSEWRPYYIEKGIVTMWGCEQKRRENNDIIKLVKKEEEN